MPGWKSLTVGASGVGGLSPTYDVHRATGMSSVPMNTVEHVAPVSPDVIAGFTPGPRPGSVSVAAESPWTDDVPAGPSPGGEAATDWPADSGDAAAGAAAGAADTVAGSIAAPATAVINVVATAVALAARLRRTAVMKRSHHDIGVYGLASRTAGQMWTSTSAPLRSSCDIVSMWAACCSARSCSLT